MVLLVLMEMVFLNLLEIVFHFQSRSENIFPSLVNGGNGHHLYWTLPHPLPVTLPISCFYQIERYKTTFALLACTHEDVNYVCAHVLKMSCTLTNWKEWVSYSQSSKPLIWLFFRFLSHMVISLIIRCVWLTHS